VILMSTAMISAFRLTQPTRPLSSEFRYNYLNQRLGTRTPGGTQAVRRGYSEFQIYQNKHTKGKQKGAWGYAKGVNFDLGVRE
jgi:hypothetical protein